MMHRPKSLYEFGIFRLDPAERRLLRGSKPVALTSKVFDILTMLVENSGHLLEKDELIQAIWPDTSVEEGNLTRYVSTLRKALGEGGGKHQFIETVPKRGYRFVADVRLLGAEQEDLIVHEPTRARVIVEREEMQERVKSVYATSGVRGRWEADMAAAEKKLLDQWRSIYVAWLYAYLGDNDGALKWLEKGYQERSHMHDRSQS